MPRRLRRLKPSFSHDRSISRDARNPASPFAIVVERLRLGFIAENLALVTNRCPFCTNYAYAVSVGDAYQLDCRYCDIQIEITKRAYSARCPDPVGVLEYIREKLQTSTRPRVDLPDMKRHRMPPAQEPVQEDAMPANETDALTSAAKAIGTTLGKLAVKAGIVSAPHPVETPDSPKPPAQAKPTRKVAAKKKAPAVKAAAATKKKAVPKKSPRKTAAKKSARK